MLEYIRKGNLLSAHSARSRLNAGARHIARRQPRSREGNPRSYSSIQISRGTPSRRRFLANRKFRILVRTPQQDYKFHEDCTREAWTVECFHHAHAVWKHAGDIASRLMASKSAAKLRPLAIRSVIPPRYLKEHKNPARKPL